MKRLALVVAVFWAIAGAGLAQEALIPAGSINSAFAKGPHAVIVGTDAGVADYARRIRRQFLAEAQFLTGAEALEVDLSGTSLLVYGTPADNVWLAQYADRLPVRFGDGELHLQDRSFRGSHLRGIFAIRNPEDTSRRAVVYTAPKSSDIVDINDLYHGPTEWVVADGGRLLESGSYKVTGPLPADALAADLEFLVETLLEVHPATADGVPKEVESAIETARAAIEEPLDRRGFWSVANRLLLSLSDAHTALAPLDNGRTINLPVRWLEDGLIVELDTAQLERGDRILSIGGLEPATIQVGLAGLIPAETPSWLRHRGEAALASTSTLEALGVDVAETVPVRVERRGGEVAVELPVGESPRRGKIEPWARFDIDRKRDLGVFTLDRCQFNDFYRRRLREFFASVEGSGIGRIAIDVRANTGGNSQVLDEFMRYLPVQAYSTYSAGIRISKQSVAQRGDEMELGLGYHEFDAQVRENDPATGIEPFAGEVFVLTSNATFSSGNWFAVVLGDNDIAPVVGEPTGNAPSCYGDILSFDLPATNLSFSMSFKRWIRPDPTRDPARSLEPDVLIPMTRADLIAGRDPVLEFFNE